MNKYTYKGQAEARRFLTIQDAEAIFRHCVNNPTFRSFEINNIDGLTIELAFHTCKPPLYIKKGDWLVYDRETYQTLSHTAFHKTFNVPEIMDDSGWTCLPPDKKQQTNQENDKELENQARQRLQEQKKEKEGRRLKEQQERNEKIKRYETKLKELQRISCQGCIFLSQTTGIHYKETIICWDCIKYQRRLSESTSSLPTHIKPLPTCTGKVLS